MLSIRQLYWYIQTITNYQTTIMQQNRFDFIRNLPSVNTRQRTMLSGGNTFTLTLTEPKQMKKSSSLAHTSKVVNYETTGIIYVKKGEEERAKLKNLEKEIKETEKQIEYRRKAIAQKKRADDFVEKRKTDDFYMTSAAVEDPNLSYTKNINMNNPKDLKNQLKIATNKISHIKKKLNESHGGNRDIMREIDSMRKQIFMYKQLNDNLNLQRQKKDARFEEVWTESKYVNEDVAMKQQELAKRKIARVHEETQLVKQYDEILKTVEKEMEMDRLRLHTGERPNFHMTEVFEASPMKRNAPFSPGKRRRLSKPLNELVSQLRSYDQAFKRIKQQSKTDNLDEISKHFKQQSQSNFRLYKYINNMNDEINAFLEEQNSLKAKLEQAKKDTKVSHMRIKEEQIEETKRELEEVLQKKAEYQKEITEYSRIVKDMKISLPTILSRLNIKPSALEQLHLDLDNIEDKQLILYLQLIQKRKNQLSTISDSTALVQSKTLKMNASDVQQQIEAAKKEFYQYTVKTDRNGAENKYNKFQERDDFVKGIEETHKFKKLKIKK